MKKQLIRILIVTLLTVLSLQSITFANKTSEKSEPTKKVLVKYKNQTDVKKNANINVAKNNKTVSTHSFLDKQATKKENVYVIEADNSTIQDMIRSDNVEYIEEDVVVKMCTDKITWNINKVKAPELHKEGFTGKGIKVALFDTGITASKDIKVAGGVSFVEGASSYNDDNGHGTAVAGILAAAKNNQGYLGVSPDIELYAVKVLDKNGAGTYSNIINGLEWAMDHDIDIICMSLGGAKYSRILQEAIDDANNRNILIVAAAGNEGSNSINYPARYNNVVCVGAVDRENRRASFSNTGAALDIVAPGVDVETIGSKLMSGTSAAVPHVAGVAAELWSAKQSMTNNQLKNLLYKSASSLGNEDTYGYGLVDAAQSLKNINTNLDQPLGRSDNTIGEDAGIDEEVHMSATKFSGDGQIVKLGNSATVGVLFTENHNNMRVTIKHTNSNTITHSEIISVRGTYPTTVPEYYLCRSTYLDKLGTYSVTFAPEDKPSNNVIFTIYVKEDGGGPIDPPDDPTDPPETPSGLALQPGISYMDLSWGRVSQAESYIIRMDGVVVEESSSASCRVRGLDPNSLYSFRVKASNSAGDSGWSSAASGYTLANVVEPREGTITNGKLTASWSANGNPSGTGYKVGVFDKSGILLKDGSWITGLNTTLTDIPKASFYFIKVKSRNFDNIESEWWTIGEIEVKIPSQANKMITEKYLGSSYEDRQPYIGDPVNSVTGNFYLDEVDLNIEDIGLPLQIQRAYNSTDERSGILGKAWRLNYESKITIDSGTGNVVIAYPDGHTTHFVPSGNGYSAPEGVFDTLEKNGSGGYKLLLRDKTVYTYNTSGKLIGISDKNNNTISLQYDGSGQLQTVTGQGGKKLYFTFEGGKIKSITDLATRNIIYSYDAQGRLHSVKGIGGGTKIYNYNEYGITSIIDENNKKFIENEYDEYRRVIKQLDENGNETQYIYGDETKENTLYHVTTGQIEKYQYNDKLYVTKVTYSDNTYEQYTYDEWGNKNSIRDRNGNVTRYLYNQRGNLLEVIKPGPSNDTDRYTYDEKDNIKQITTAGGGVTQFEYDEKGNLQKLTTKLDEKSTTSITYSYDSLGRVLTLTDAENNTTTFEYGSGPHPEKITDAENNTISYTYDTLNRKKTATTVYGTTTFVYNNQDKLEKIIDPAQNTTRLKYDSIGNLNKIINPQQYNLASDDGLGVTYQYDAMDRPITQINELGFISATKYDNQGNKIKEVNPNYYSAVTNDGLGVSYSYDKTGRLVKVTNPSGKKSRIKYDGVGNIIKTIDANNYNESTDSGLGMEYTYDQMNRLTIIKDTEGRIIKQIIYDTDGRAIKEIDGKGYLSGSDQSSRYGTINSYNLAGWLQEKRIPVKSEASTIYYQVIRYIYDKNGKILEQKTSPDYVAQSGEPKSWNVITYTYYKNGKVKSIADSLGSYIEYTYDALGNIIQEKSKLDDNTYSIVGYEYNNIGKVQKTWRESSAGRVETTFEYDKNGNLMSLLSPAGHKTVFEYDAANRLIKKSEEVSESTININHTTVSLTALQGAVLPGQQSTYKLEIQPDTTVIGFDIQIEYDARVCEFIEAKAEEAGITVNADIEGKIKLSTSSSTIDQKALLASITFKIKEDVSGKGYVIISPTSTYTDHEGKKKFAEGTGKTVANKSFDMNKDGKVEINDFSLLAQKVGLAKGNPNYDEKFDIDGNGVIEKLDLDALKDYLLTATGDEALLNPIKQAPFAEKFTNLSYKEETHTTTRTTNYEYDKAGNLTKEINTNGNSITYGYDAYNRLTSLTDQIGNTTSITYDEIGNKTKETLPEGNSITYVYDAMNRLQEVRDTQGNILQKNSYDINSLVIRTTDAKTGLSSGVEYTYDIGNRLQTITTPEAKAKGKTSTTYTYDALGNAATYTDGENNTTTYERDMWGKIRTLIDPYNVRSIYNYDYAGNVRSTTDGNNNTTQYIYNSLNQLTEIKDPSGQSITYEYDKDGRMIKEYDRNGQTLIYKYNSDNNLISRSVNTTGEEEKYLYNKDGSLLGAIGFTGVDTFEYTSAGQLLRKLRNGKLVLEYDYDKNGNVKRVTDVTGQTVQYNYDNNGRLQTVLNGNSEVTSYQYNSDNTLSSVNYSSGINISYSYDKDKNIISLIQRGSQGNINNFTYTYDNNGNQVSKVENGVGINYTYDKVGRLLTAGNNTYSYDNAGNRKSWSGSHGSTTYNYDSRNRLVTVTDSAKGSIVYGYDNNGNQLTASNGTVYTYDGFNRLKTVAMPGGNRTVNEYDALGLRIATIENGLRYDFIFDRGNILTEVNAADELVARNLRGLGLIAKENVAGELNYYLNNAHGDVVSLVNGAGAILNSYEYDAFGNTTNYAEQVINRFRYAGEQFDNLTGQYYLRARYYNPQDGRFTQEDTYRGDGLNLYTYVQNNPIRYVDPSGYWSILVSEDTYGSNEKIRYLHIVYDNLIVDGAKIAANTFGPLGSFIDYGDRAQWFGEKMTELTTGYDNVYTYKPDKEIIDAWETFGKGNDLLGLAVSNSTKKLLQAVKKVGTYGMLIKDGLSANERAKKDNFLYGMIRSSGLDRELRKVRDPADLYIAMTAIESILDNYSSKEYINMYNKYFGSSLFGIGDYDYAINLWDKTFGDIDKKRGEIKNAHNQLYEIAKKLKDAYNGNANCKR